MDLTIDLANGMCLMADRALKVKLWAVSGLNLKRIGLIRCLYIFNSVIIDKYNTKNV